MPLQLNNPSPIRPGFSLKKGVEVERIEGQMQAQSYSTNFWNPLLPMLDIAYFEDVRRAVEHLQAKLKDTDS